MKRVLIPVVPGTSIAEDKDVAASLRKNDVLPALKSGEKVELDFKDVGTATQSFVHALIADAIRQNGDASFELLVFRNCSSAVQEIIKTVFGYTLFAAETAEHGA